MSHDHWHGGGSLAHANGLPAENVAGAELRAIAALNTPTPVTRSGPGANDSIKPDLVDFGGTCLFDGMATSPLEKYADLTSDWRQSCCRHRTMTSERISRLN
jgi:hypothetical protein